MPPLEAGEAIRIMTGAPLPMGADAVVRFEETDQSGSGGQAGRESVLVYRAARPLDNVREAGEDIARGTPVARRGQVLRPADLGLIASVGEPTVRVHRRPIVAVLSTGNEVVAPGDELMPGTIRDSNSFVIGALARSWGADVRLIGIARDTVDDLTGRLAGVGEVDLIVTSGGVSLGDYDLVKDVLKSKGEVAIWQVRMKPGKPLAFGHIGVTLVVGPARQPGRGRGQLHHLWQTRDRKMLGLQVIEPRMVEVVTADSIDNRGPAPALRAGAARAGRWRAAAGENRGRAGSRRPQLPGCRGCADGRARGVGASAAGTRLRAILLDE